MDQIPDYDDSFSTYDVLKTAFEYVNKIGNQMKNLEKDMSILKDKELKTSIKKYADIQHMFEVKGGYKVEENINKICNGFGFDEGFIYEYQGTVLIISHDRYFLDKEVDKVIEIEDGGVDIYHGNYTYYTEEKEKSGKKVQEVTQKKEKQTEDKKTNYQAMIEERAKAKRKQTLEAKIYKLEKELEDIDNKMTEYSGDYVKLTEMYKERWKVQVELEKAYEEWGR